MQSKHGGNFGTGSCTSSVSHKLRRPYDSEQLQQSRQTRSIQEILSQLLFIEVFAGVGHLARAFSQKGFQVIMWD
eukprot:12424170-Karenia_brevis.AAC.1